MEGDVSIMAKVLNNSVWCQYLGEVFIEHGLTLPSLTLANLVVLTSLIFMVRIFSFFFFSLCEPARGTEKTHCF